MPLKVGETSGRASIAGRPTTTVAVAVSQLVGFTTSQIV